MLSNLPGMVTLADPRDVAVGAPALCDHDGRASGRLTFEDGDIRREIVCECGQVLALLGRQEYHLGGEAAPRRRPTGLRWRRSTAQAARVFRRSIARNGLRRRGWSDRAV
jgi:hypothetical protein